MAVSYLSKVYEANPYVIPLDLNLLARVNSYKQQQFYQNADKLGGMLGNLHNTDIANKEQSDKLKQQAGNLQNQLNNAGGIDFSDRGVVNQIESYGSEIYNDPDITRGIISTKKIRAFQKNVEKMQTDPKLSKYFNVSNVTRIMEQQIKPYVSGGISAGYDGPTAPRPYEGNPFEKMLKNMKNLPADVEIRVDDGNPSLYQISTNTKLSAEKIDAAFDGLIDANTKAQLIDDAWYNFDYGTGYKFDKKMGQDLYNNDMLNKSRSAQTAMDAAKIELGKTLDPEKKVKLQTVIDNYQLTKEFADGEITKDSNEWGKMWDKDPNAAKYSLYVGKMRGDVIKAAGFNREKLDIKTNQQWLSQEKMRHEAYKQGYQLNSDGSLGQMMPWAKANEVTVGADGKKRNAKGEIIEPKDGLLAGTTELTASTRDEDETKALLLTEDAVNNQIYSYQKTNNQIFTNILSNIARKSGDPKILDYEMNVNTTVGGIAQTFSSDLISNLAGKDGLLDIDDIKRVDALTRNIPKDKAANLTYQGKTFGVTHDQIAIVREIRQGMEDFAQGKADKAPPALNGMAVKWMEFNKEYQYNQMNIDSKRKYVDRVTEDAFSKVTMKLTPQEKALLKDFETGKRRKVIGKERISNPGSIMGTGTSSYGDKFDSQYEELLRKVDRTALATEKQKAYAAASKTYNYYSATVGNNPDIEDHLKKIITQKDESVDFAKVVPLSIMKNDDGKDWKILYKAAAGEKNKTIGITENQAKQLGIRMFKRPEVEEYFAYGDIETPVLSTYTKIVDPVSKAEKVQPISFKILQNAEGDYVSVILHKGNRYEINNPNGVFSNANAALDAMETLASEGRFNSLEQLLAIIETRNSGL